MGSAVANNRRFAAKERSCRCSGVDEVSGERTGGGLAGIRLTHPGRLVGVSAERPFAIDMLPGVDCSHDRRVVVGYLHTAPSTWDLQIDGKRDRLSEARRYA